MINHENIASRPPLHAVVMPRIAILCAASRSAYHEMEGVEVYDRRRDARSFTGGMPVVAHPPCRAWSAFCAHQAKPEPGEKELGLWCVEQVKEWGGILEQPAHSRLFDAANLPKPGWEARADSWSLEVWQAWWGYPQIKATWLYFSKISPLNVLYPFQLFPQGVSRRSEQVMSRQQRSRTIRPFAEWLVATARLVGA